LELFQTFFQFLQESSVMRPVLRPYLVHYLDKETIEKMATITAPVNSLEAFTILFVLQGERESIHTYVLEVCINSVG
jgi:hypothetical protein